MTEETLDLNDIQGNILRGYGRFGFPKSRYVFLSIDNADKARDFVQQIISGITTSARWEIRADGTRITPEATTNMAFTYPGLKAIEVPTRSLKDFPAEFMMGMKRRVSLLGDDGPSAPEHWDAIWQNQVHIWISINAKNDATRETRYQWLTDLIKANDGGVSIISGHKGPNGQENLDYQDGSALEEKGQYSAKEHFGFTDGIGDPVFKGQSHDKSRVAGRGKPTKEGGWEELATGEFILGYASEAKQLPPAPKPAELSTNSSFLVYRKLHENVASFNQYIAKTAANYPDQEDLGADYPSAEDLLKAKFSGRWADDGAPLMLAPDRKSKGELNKKMAQLKEQASSGDASAKAQLDEYRLKWIDFDYNDDLKGSKCPFSSHIRRINPRGSLQFGETKAFNTPGALVNRRRILRRGLPYGKVDDPTRDDGNHGIIFMTVGASIERQFEFVQQQWINYGNDFKESSDKEPLLGNHNPERFEKITIPGDPAKKQRPFFCTGMPRFVETRGGDYFFIPSMTALRLIAKGIIDPT